MAMKLGATTLFRRLLIRVWRRRWPRRCAQAWSVRYGRLGTGETPWRSQKIRDRDYVTRDTEK